MRNHVSREIERDRGIAPDAMHAGVDLQVHAERIAAGRGHGIGEGIDPRLAVHDRCEPAGYNRVGQHGHRLRQDENRRFDAGIAQLDALFDQRDREPRRAGVDRGARTLGRAVAVAVRFDDRAHRGRRDQLVQRPHVGAYCLEVDLGPDRALRLHQRMRARHSSLPRIAT